MCLSKLFSELIRIISMGFKSNIFYGQSGNQNQNKTEQIKLHIKNIWGVILWGSSLFQSTLYSITFSPSCQRSIWSLTPTAAQNFLSSLFTNLISNSSVLLDPVLSHIAWSFLCPAKPFQILPSSAWQFYHRAQQIERSSHWPLHHRWILSWDLTYFSYQTVKQCHSLTFSLFSCLFYNFLEQ